MVQMKAHAQRTARLQLIASMLEGQPWQQAMTNANLSIGRSTAYRLVQLAVIERLVLTLLFLAVAGLARAWDLRTYTGTMLALVTGRGCAYSYAYVELFLSRSAHARADERLTDALAQWTWALWHDEQTQQEQEQEKHRAVLYVDGHRKAVYSAVLVPSGPE